MFHRPRLGASRAWPWNTVLPQLCATIPGCLWLVGQSFPPRSRSCSTGGCEEYHPSPGLWNSLSRDGKGPCWLEERSLPRRDPPQSPHHRLDKGPRPPVIPTHGDIEFSVCFASVIGQDAVKGGESAQGRGVKEIGKHY